MSRIPEMSKIVMPKNARSRLAARIGQVGKLALIAFFLILIFFPFLWAVSTSLKPDNQIQTYPPVWLPRRAEWANYVYIWKVVPLGRYFENTIIVSVAATLVALVLSLFGAYAFSRFRFRGKGVLAVSLLATEMIPGTLFLIPYYMLFIAFTNSTGIPMVATYHGLILTYVAFNLAFSVWMLRGFFDAIPQDLEAAAEIDGCTKTQAFWKVAVPLILPGVVAVGVITFISTWNELLFASALTNEATRTVVLGLTDYRNKFHVNWNYVTAAGIVVTLPILAIFTALQKHIVSGLTAGAVKQ